VVDATAAVTAACFRNSRRFIVFLHET